MIPERQTNRQNQKGGEEGEGRKCYLSLGERDASVTRTTVPVDCSFKATNRDVSSTQRKGHKDLTVSAGNMGSCGPFPPKAITSEGKISSMDPAG